MDDITGNVLEEFIKTLDILFPEKAPHRVVIMNDKDFQKLQSPKTTTRGAKP